MTRDDTSDRPALDGLLDDAVARGDAPCLVAMIANSEGLLYSHAVERAGGHDAPITASSIFWLASLSKAVTSAAALQLIETGRLRLDTRFAELLPQFADVQVLIGVAADGIPQLRAPRRPIELRHLLTHTSGLGYDMMSPLLTDARAHLGQAQALSLAALHGPLLFDPGDGWSYGTSTDWVGLAIAAAAGCPLADYLSQKICSPLAMRDTGFMTDPSRSRRVVPLLMRGADDSFFAIPSPASDVAAWEYSSGGAGLSGTAGDYIRFLRMLLRGGTLDGVRVLSEESCGAMLNNQIGDIRAGATGTAEPAVISALDLFSGMRTGWSMAGMTNPGDVGGGRRAGSMGWAGLPNLFYWVDPASDLCAVLMSQFFPFADQRMIALLRRFEAAAYEEFAR